MMAFVEELNENKKSPMGLWLCGRIMNVNCDSLIMEFLTRKEMTDESGQMHGGIISTLIEEVINLMVNSSCIDIQWRCSDLNVKFVHTIDLGQNVRVEAFVNPESSVKMHAEAKVYDSRRELIAYGSVRLKRA